MFKSNQSTCSSFTAKLRALLIFIKKITSKITIISVISNIFLIAHVPIISKPKNKQRIWQKTRKHYILTMKRLSIQTYFYAEKIQ